LLVALAFETLRGHGNLVLLMFMGFFVLVHCIFIWHKLVPIVASEPSEDEGPPGGHGGTSLSAEEEDALLKRLLKLVIVTPRLAGSAGAV
jgi:hypothetical protein